MQMNESFRSILAGIATALSVSAICSVGSMYIDVQMIKEKQQQQIQLSSVVQQLDKQVSLNIQAVESLNRIVSKLSDKIEKGGNNDD